MSGTPLVGWLLVGMGSRKGLSTLDDTLGLTGKLSRCDRNKQPPQNCRAGQGDILVRGSGTAASRSFMHCQKYRCSRSPPRNQLRTWPPPPLTPAGPQTLVSAVQRASHDSAGSFRILAQTSVQRLAVVLGIACSPPNPPKTAKTSERMAPKRRESSPSPSSMLHRFAGGAVLAGDRTTAARG